MKRIAVMPACAPRCASCIVCPPHGEPASLVSVLEASDADEILLGGGDATRWPFLERYVARMSEGAPERRVFVEASARVFTRERLAWLASVGVHGVVVIIEGVGEQMRRVLRVGDGELAIAEAESVGLEARARVVARPSTFPMVAPLARRLSPRTVYLELVRADIGRPSVPIWPSVISELLLARPNVSFASHRRSVDCHLPPCALPAVWTSRPEAFRPLLGEAAAPNEAFEACARCTLRTVCRFGDVEALAPEERATLVPVTSPRLPWDDGRPRREPVPAAIVAKRSGPEVVCTAPWTTLEIVDPNGLAYQCCTTWTVESRGSVLGASLAGVWNGPGYREARRIMAREDRSALCNPICSRLHDRAEGEARFAITCGSERFVANQLLLAEDIAERRELIRARPLRMALCPSTYCNYDCIMCHYGHMPRRELPESVWDELPEFLPTLRTLTLLGGEPLANPRTMQFLREFDRERYPDCAIDFVTNGSLLNEATLARMSRCTLGDVTLSLNAGTPAAYEQIQRGIALEKVLDNLDALLRFRATQPRAFGVSLSFVVQPASAATLIPFGEIAHARALRIRLLALNPEDHEGLDFYVDPDRVAAVLQEVERFERWAREVRPEWLREIRAVRDAIVAEAEARMASVARGERQDVGDRAPRRLPVLPR